MFYSLFQLKYYLIWIIFNLLLAFFIHNQSKKYFKNPPLKNTNRSEREIIFNREIHEKHPEWNRLDKLSFWRIFLGLIFLFWTKFIILCLLMVIITISLKIMRIRPNQKQNSHIKRNMLVKFNDIIYGLALFIIGLKAKRVKNRYDMIYKKYLGPNYESTFDDKYSIIICNHFSWIEILYFLKIFSPGFISKESVKHYPFIGEIAKSQDCLFIDRTNSENRTQVADQVKIRQDSYMNGTCLNPLIVFPEGTVTNGKYLLKFKRGRFIINYSKTFLGPFQSLLPVKPIIIRTDQDPEVILSFCAIKLFYHQVISFSYFYHELTFEEIPIITPTEFMFLNYSHLGDEKWKIFAEVVREIYCEIARFKKSDKTFNDFLDYLSLLNKTTVTNT